MNIANFQILLQKAIDNSTTTIDYLLLSKALQSLNMGQIRAVATYANLPSAASNEGLLVWVTADERLYWSTGVDWYSIVANGKGIAYAWGSGIQGRLGNNNTIDFSSPVSVVGGITDWCQVSASSDASVAIRTNGTMWAWGSGGVGSLGNNSTSNQSSPVSVVGGFTDWCQVSAGSSHILAVRTNGTAWAWGGGGYGRLGNDCTSNQSSPVSIVGGFTNWCQVSGGFQHSLGLRTNGSLWAWGRGNRGQLGNYSTSNFSSPVSVVGGFTDWCQISAGGSYQSIALRTNGTIWAWGCGSNGRLGNNCTSNFSSPVSVVGGITNWCRISAGYTHALALRANGSLWAWGTGVTGQLGDNTNANKSSPVSVVGGFTDWCQISGGYKVSAAVRTNGTAWAWGCGVYGQLGNNCTSEFSSPVSVIGGFTDWCQIGSIGGNHVLGIRSTNFV